MDFVLLSWGTDTDTQIQRIETSVVTDEPQLVFKPPLAE